MKWLISKKIYILIILLSGSFTFINAEDKGETRYDKNIIKYKAKWENLIPSYSKFQYAGSMGLVSIGPGWDYGKNDQWETDLMIGIVPAYSTNETKLTLTLKQNFIPWKINLKKSNFSIDPLACGIYVNSIFGDNFWSREPDKYPNKYYKFSTKLRFHVYIGQRFTYNIPSEKRRNNKSITAFYEISSSELYLMSAFTNSYLKPTDYLHLSLGVKFQIF